MNNIIEILEKCNTIGDVAKEIKGYSNGRTNKIAKKYIIENGYEYKFLNSSEDKYNKNPKICKNCNEIIQFDKKYNVQFCSNSCSAIYNNKIRAHHSDETKKKISLSLKSRIIEKNDNANKIFKEYKRNCICCDKEFVVEKLENGKLSRRKTCSDECNFNLRSENSKKLMERLIKTGKHKGWQSRNILSYPENFFIQVLNNNNLKYEFNFMIKKIDLGFNDSGNYFLDFYFPDKKIDLEIDGKQHKYNDRKESDEIRDNSLQNYGIKIYRIKWKSINNNKGKEYIENEICKFLDFYNNLPL